MDKIITEQMPPTDPKLTPEEIEIIRAWIDNGAPGEGADKEGTASSLPLVTEREILPILQARCVACHGKREQRGGLDLRTQESRLKGGKSGPALVPGKPGESLLIRKIEEGLMPPLELQSEYPVRPPTEDDLQLLRNWVATGCPPAPDLAATDDPAIPESSLRHWAFQPPKRPDVPRVKDQQRVVNPVDAFLLQKLEEIGLTYSAEAEPLTLLRRVFLDLTGMPPSPEDVDAYLNEKRSDRYERVVSRLLDSADYGERWARHWLDLAGYSDSEGFGFEDTVRPYAWRFRDYVIRSFNADKPYDKFLTEQIAGDEMGKYPDEPVTQSLIDRLAATGFLRTAPDPTFANAFGFLPHRMDVIADEVKILSSAVLGLTIECARCHDHKYDPISQRDYYRFSAILQTAYDPYDWLRPEDRTFKIGLEEEKKETDDYNAPLEKELARLEQSLDVQEKPFREKLLEERLAVLPEDVREDLRGLLDIPEDQRSEVQKYLVEKFGKTIKISTNDVIRRFETFKQSAEPLRRQIRELKDKLRPEPYVRALFDTGGEPSTHYLLRRGDPLNPGDPVPPGVPKILSFGIPPYEVNPQEATATSSGRRLALARWLTQPDHPLTSRVMVNQLWLRHFGRGLVSTPANFGLSGRLPSHPELLDWLATEFVRSGWSLKHMHRLMVTSRAYRQSSRNNPERLAADPENVLLARMAMRRMDAEQVYDSVLKITGRLDTARFGLPEEVNVTASREVVAGGSEKGFRRSIYVLQRHTTPLSLLEAYDLPRMTPNCLERRQSNVATQALQMFNGSEVWLHSKHMAGRVIDDVGDDAKKQVRQVFLLALSRPPSEFETQESLSALEDLTTHWMQKLEDDRAESPKHWTAHWMALASLCRTVLNSGKFIFVD